MTKLSQIRRWAFGLGLWALGFLALALVSCESPAPTGSATQPPSGAQQQTRPETNLLNGPTRDLSQDERFGGHVLRKHVGQSEADLRRRLQREENITTASTYTDRNTAEHVVGAAAELAEAVVWAGPRVHIVATSREPLRWPITF